MDIPILNLYYLLCYAWDQLREGEVVEVSVGDPKTLADLFARVLIGGTNHLLRRGVDRGYVEHDEAIRGLRGKLDISTSIKTGAFVRGRAHCRFDELSHDILHNRILKTTLRRLAGTEGLDRGFSAQLDSLARRFDTVREIPISTRTFGRVQLDRNNAFYAFLMNVCLLVHESVLVDTESGIHRFRDFLRDEQRMWRVFQNFVRHFFAREQDQYRVTGRQLPWQEVVCSEDDHAFLPGLETDVTLESRQRTIIIDTKYYKQALVTRPQGTEKVRSDHLYQIFAYLVNYARAHRSRPVEGLLLYPTVAKHFDFRYTIMGFPVRIAAIDLNQDWRGIHGDMLALLN